MSRIEAGQNYYDAPEPLHPTGSNYPEVANFKSLDAAAPTVMHLNVGPRRLGDMKASTFWIILGLVCALISGATIGGAVGGSMAGRNNNQAASSSTQISSTYSSATQSSTPKSSTATPTASSASSSTATPVISPSTDCQNGTTYESLFKTGANGAVPTGAGLSFTKLCATNEGVSNIGSGYFYTFEDCIELCAGLNFWSGDRRCLGVTYDLLGNRPVNCWAHDQTAVVPTTDRFDTAILANK